MTDVKFKDQLLGEPQDWADNASMIFKRDLRFRDRLN
jgi:hypothetical protein